LNVRIDTDIYAEWIDAKRQEAAARTRRVQIEAQLIELHGFDATREGTETYLTDKYRVKCSARVTQKVDAKKLKEIARDNGLDDQIERLFRWRVDMNKNIWKKTHPDITNLFLPAIESKPSKPAVVVEKIEEQPVKQAVEGRW
jgi:hypothetical protein